MPENFTPTKADSAYLKALNNGNFAAAQVAVNEAAETTENARYAIDKKGKKGYNYSQYKTLAM